ncbi:hypothetical protein DFQ27_001180 [Actinomortierella ambigua]|uniref:CUE domain-containing protein n=1 Tax=Actinomortierella ambigua TaxID=1343610 RepID=A0A9P6U8T3_9FUNG|nr:hypothetical protein DFQ27_001180 [Actinomortierella ambigua]
MSSIDKDSKTASASTDDAVPYNVTDAPTSSTDNSNSNSTTSPTVASKENAKKDNKDPFGGDDDDDDDLQIHPAIADDASAPTNTASPPASAPASSPQEAERLAKLAILTEAFPTVEKEICEFVLETHRGNVEGSINALLEMSDPEYRPEAPQPPPQQRQPSQQPQPQQRSQGRPPQQMPIQLQVPIGPAVPPLPRRSPPNQDGGVDAAADEFARMRLQQQPRAEIDPILLASTSTPEQQLRSDEDFARTLAAMDEYRARREQPQPQQGEQGPTFAQEMKELMDEELPKIKERFNAAADTTKKKVNEWYEKFKASRAEAAARDAGRRDQGNASNEAYYQDDGRYDNYRQDTRDHDRDPIRFGERRDSDEPLARHRATPPLPARRSTQDDAPSIAVESDTATATLLPDGRRTTVEDVADKDK